MDDQATAGDVVVRVGRRWGSDREHRLVAPVKEVLARPVLRLGGVRQQHARGANALAGASRSNEALMRTVGKPDHPISMSSDFPKISPGSNL